MSIAVGTNSYVDVDTADTYFETRLNASAWTDASDDSKEAALITACERIDQERFRGRKSMSTQALEWPRLGVIDRSSYVVESDVVPESVKRAQMKLALALLSEDLLVDTGLEGFESVEVGPIKVVPSPRKAGALPEDVRRELLPFLAYEAGTRTDLA